MWIKNREGEEIKNHIIYICLNWPVRQIIW